MIYTAQTWQAAFAQKQTQRRTLDNHEATVRAIIDDVRHGGDGALYDYTLRFDQCRPPALTLGPETWDQAEACPSDVKNALRLAAERIRAFHSLSLPQNVHHEDPLGLSMGVTWQPLSRVGVYVPGGTAVYPSSVLMNVIPAKVAGVPFIAMAVPTPHGVLNPALLYAARLAGVDVIHPVGGAQAIAALAYGTESVGAVDKIVGPGNAFVAEAKRQVMGQVGIDSYAGPSEVLIVADSKQNPTWLAWDLLAQAEHDPRAQSILITDDLPLAQAVQAEVNRLLPTLPRAETATQSWRDYGMIIIIGNVLHEVPALVATIAPEHLQLCLDNPDPLIPHIRHVGSLFIGAHTPEALGDYVAGPNHVLPTCGTARFASGLSVYDFFRRMTYLRGSPEALTHLGPPAATLAQAEGLSCHENSLRARF
jgi:histidinol dehydrogenase